MTELHYKSLAEVGERIRRGELSPVAVVGHLVERIHAFDSRLHSFITLSADEALRAAREAEREIAAGRYRSPLHGIPFAVKDSIATAGTRTTANSRALADWVPSEDAVVVRRLREAGAILLGKLNMNELGWSLPSPEDLAPPPLNPWNPEYRAIGSSTGPGVAAAAGFCYATLGTDAGGSTRLPGGQMGLIGLKPTHGRVPHGGVLSSGSISEVGVLARTALDAALVLRTIAGYEPGEHDSIAEPVPDYASLLRGGVGGLKLGVPRDYIASVPVEPEVGRAFEEALGVLRDLGTQVRDVEVPDMSLARSALFIVLNGEAGTGCEGYLRAHRDRIGRSAQAYFLTASFLPASDYLRALQFREHFRGVVDRAFDAFDVLVTPTSPKVTAEAARRPGQHGRGINASFTAPFNLSGHPGISIPRGRGALGIPIGLQVVGPRLSEATLLRVAHAYCEATSVHKLHPDLGELTKQPAAAADENGASGPRTAKRQYVPG